VIKVIKVIIPQEEAIYNIKKTTTTTGFRIRQVRKGKI
jgi:hypothetical protein